MNFRKLRADEIDVRVGVVSKEGKGVALLLYKDARCDMSILDETVGALNWTRKHLRDNANCIVSIWDKDKSEWIGKEDTGTESNTEKEKGLASDSFKRACFNWGIGRELYTAPLIWISSDKCNIKPYGNGYTCRDRFNVKEIDYNDNKISRLVIGLKGTTVYQYDENATAPIQASQPAENKAPHKKTVERQATEKQVNMLRSILKTDEQIEWAQTKYNISDPKDLTIEQASEIIKLYKEKKGV